MVSERVRTVAFFEVVRSVDGAHERVAQMPWPQVLADVHGWDLKLRRTQVDRDLIGEPYLWSGDRALLLHRVKGDDEWLARADFTTGSIEQLELLATQGYLESSVIEFVGFGNIIAMMQGSTSAPSHKALEEWLNSMGLFPGTDLLVRPVMSKAEVQRLRGAGGIQRIELKVGQLNPIESHGRLTEMIRSLRASYDDAEVTLTISIPRGREFVGGGRSQYRELYDDVMGLGSAITDADRARASLVYMDGDDSGRRRVAELVEHHITAKRSVPVTDAEGNVVRIYAAARVIRDVIREHYAELRDALSVEATDPDAVPSEE